MKKTNETDKQDSSPIDLEKEIGIKSKDIKDLKESLEKKEKKGKKIYSRRDIRTLAFHLLYAADRFDYSAPLDQIVDSFCTGFELDIPPDSLAIQMAKGVLEKKDELDALVEPLLKNWKMERLGCCTLLILRLALWELTQPDAIPSIVINEAVELAKSFAEKDAYKFVNGILDEIRKQLKLEDKDSGKPKKKGI